MTPRPDPASPTRPGLDVPGAEPVQVPGDTSPPARRSWLGAVWSAAQLVISLSIAGAVLAWLLWPSPKPTETAAPPPLPQQQVEVAGPRLIRIRSDAPICAKLQTVRVATSQVTVPMLRVTGTVAASRRPGGDKEDFWQFDSPDVLTTYSDWDKARADVKYSDMQLANTRELAEARNNAQAEVVARLKKLVATGTETLKDLKAEETTLLQNKITGQKEVHEAENALRVAQKTAAALARQIQQAGLDPEMLRTATSDVDIVLAQVPESRLSRVSLGQSCEARFYGFPDRVFNGKVTSMSPVLSKERRTLRVLFTLHDPDDLLRPGMFADILLGTDAHTVLKAPAVGVVHVGREDYMLTRSSESEWRVTTVQLGEVLGGDLEVLGGLREGDVVLGKGAILLKPFIIAALRADTSQPSAARRGTEVRR